MSRESETEQAEQAADLSQAEVDAPTLPAESLASQPDTAATRTEPGVSMIGRELIGQYVIRDKLGSGGMGEVYLADQPALGRKVAIKVLHAQLVGMDGQLERFRNEAKAAASLPSAHIVEIFNWGELEDGTLFMAMEYLHGQTLGELLQANEGLTPELCVSLATQICTALGEAHAAGIVHRDLKPSNVMLLERDDDEHPYQVKVLDFGVAKLEGSDITQTGAMFGTPQYMSPEQLRAGPIDGRSDLYSLGVMLYEMLSGELPFRSPSAVGYITAHLHDTPSPLPRGIPRALAELVLVLMSKVPDERPPDATMAAAELEAALLGGSPGVRRRARRRAARRAALVTGVSAVIVALGLSAWQLWRGWEQTQAQLALEQERAMELEHELQEQQLAATEAREQARTLAEQQLESSNKVREERTASTAKQRRERVRKLDGATRAMLTRTRGQLEGELHDEIAKRRVPPSEYEDMWSAHEQRAAAVLAGELEDAELREHLMATILLYRKSFERKQPGDDLPLERLEQRFLTMDTGAALDAQERRAMIDAIYEIYETEEDVPPADRSYLKQLALAKLVRQHASRRTKDPMQALPTPGSGGEDEQTEAEATSEEPATNEEPALPSLDGL